MSESFGIGDNIDGNNLYVISVKCRLEHTSADTSEAIDSYLH